MSALRAIRQSLGLTLTEFARRVGVSHPIVSRVERGELRPYPKFRRQAAKVLRVREEILFPAPAAKAKKRRRSP